MPATRVFDVTGFTLPAAGYRGHGPLLQNNLHAWKQVSRAWPPPTKQLTCLETGIASMARFYKNTYHYDLPAKKPPSTIKVWPVIKLDS